MLGRGRGAERVLSPYFTKAGEGVSDGQKVGMVKEEQEEGATKKAKKARKAPVKVEYSVEPPAGWEAIYTNIETMRAERSAPVDTMGCERWAHDETAEPAVRRFQCLVSLMLSSQTKDEVNFAAMLRLREHGLTVDSVLATTEDRLGELIRPVGFWRNKAKYLLEVCRVLRDQHDGDIPDTLEGLCALKGVGPKMAHICLAVAWGRPEGIGVDTHVHRIAGRLGWSTGCSKPEETRQSLEAWLPRARWAEINWLLVGFGQEVCLPVGPRCGDCLNRELCPTGRGWSPSPRKAGTSKRSKVPQ